MGLILTQLMLLTKRRYYIIGVKKALMKAIVTLAGRYFEPTRENCIHPNSHRLFDIEDDFFECEHNSGRDALFRALWKILIVEYEHDPYYRYRIDWVIEKIAKSGWKPRSREKPMRCWTESDA